MGLTMPALRLMLLTLGVCCTLSTTGLAQEKIDYLKHVKPILNRHCLECHNAKKSKGELRVDTGLELLKGGKSGPVVMAGESGKSLLIDSLKGNGKVKRMPYKRSPLSKKEIEVLVKWIDQGAKVPSMEAPSLAKHWAFQTPIRPKLPAVKDQAWI